MLAWRESRSSQWLRRIYSTSRLGRRVPTHPKGTIPRGLTVDRAALPSPAGRL